MLNKLQGGNQMDKLLELLGVAKLDESIQEEVKTKLQDIIEVKAKELSEDKITETKEKLVEDYEAKFDEYKEEITSKFSNFVDSVLDEEMVIPEKILEYAKKGELYDELIEQFKVRLALDEGMLDDEVKGLLKEAKEEIISLRGQMDEITAKGLDNELENQKMAAELHLRKKTDGLTESQKEHIIEMLGDILDIDEIDRKFELVLETSKKKVKEEEDKEDDKEEDDKEEDDKEEDDKEEDDKEVDEKEEMKGKGKAEIKKDDEEDDEKMDESASPFKEYMDQYVSVLKSNKI